jgi:hypothetical protein
MKLSRHVAATGDKSGAYMVLMGRPEGKRPLKRRRRRWDDTIKLNLKDVGWGGMDWIDLTEGRNWRLVLVKVVMTFGFHTMRGIS